MIVQKKNNSNAFVHWLTARPGRIIFMSFLLVIIIGAILLGTPIASKDGRSAGFLRALFTATSATCVTGLVTADTATQWTIFGKVVIIILIQIGGLGLVTLTSFFYSFMRRKFSLKTLVVTQESTANFGFADVLKLVRKIVLITFSIELAGGLLIAWRFIPRYGWGKGIGKALFHSVSSFCNAGFDLLGDTDSGPLSSLTGWNNDPAVILTTAVLIVVGGLGFIVWSDLLEYRKNLKINYHSRVVLSMTGILIAAGTIFFLAVEYNNTQSAASMGSLPAWQRPFAALFQAITPRTAGFNSIDMATMTDSSKLVTVFLMFIGAAPGSTGGGIKVSTFAVILATIFSDVRGNDDIILFRHRLSRETFTRATAIMGLAISIVLFATLAMSFIERAALESGRISLLDLVFEATSAFGTVGLSSANTPDLQPASWAVLIPAMFLGRVGPASFAISLMMLKGRKRDMIYPEGKTMVG